MDPPPPGTAGATTAPTHGGFTDPTPMPTLQAKLRLLCSYGGKIAPRSHDKALCYVGGETRIVAVDRRSVASLSFLSAHLSHALLNGRPFSLKYQLPRHDLDSFISITTDDDLVNMIDEYDRLSLSPQSIRLRFFLFPAKADPSSPDSNLQDLKFETWFFDAFRNARRFADSGTGQVLVLLKGRLKAKVSVELSRFLAVRNRLFWKRVRHSARRVRRLLRRICRRLGLVAGGSAGEGGAPGEQGEIGG
ncbi:hypothetical protein Ancab_002642 [Ancistrocladus abbreviatus]